MKYKVAILISDNLASDHEDAREDIDLLLYSL